MSHLCNAHGYFVNTNCVFTPTATKSAKSVEVIDFVWTRVTKATKSTSNKIWVTRAT